jgi:hypothetical protein
VTKVNTSGGQFITLFELSLQLLIVWQFSGTWPRT